MKTIVAAFGSGFLFAVGLGISGMTNPNKVMNFLDIAGSWDPSLALVMGGALGVSLVMFRRTLRRESPLWAESFHLPAKRDLDIPLLSGSVLFGVGWGLAGFCPGPALTSLVTGKGGVVTFVAAMLAGMVLQELFKIASGRRFSP